MLFIDGDETAQIDWALGQARGERGAKLILVKGAPLELMKAQQRRVYFDQGGKLVGHFGIGAVPAIVEQQGRRLRISEVALGAPAGATR